MSVARSKSQRRYAVVRATFNAPITQALLDGALRAFAEAGVSKKHLTVIEVPGAFELPIASLWLAQSKKYAAVVALGCVIRGETPHFEYVARETSRGLQEVALKTGVPVALGVLTTENETQAWARATSINRSTPHHGDTGHGNKGFEAAQVAMAMARARSDL